MTAVEELLAPTASGKLEPEKDRYGRYLIAPREGGKGVAHTRATTFIKALDSGGEGLKLWFARYAVKGVASDEARLGRVSTMDPDPVDDAEAKKEFNRILEDATVAAGINTKRDKGTALHDATELVDALTSWTPAPWMVAPLDHYRRLRDDFGFVWLESEQIVVIPEFTVAGRFDRIADVKDPAAWPGARPWSKPRLLDIKTGSIDYPGSFAIQLTVYASAGSIYDPKTNTHRDMVDIDRDTGLVLHLPPDGSGATLYEVDLTTARDLPAVAKRVRQWANQGRKVLTYVNPQPVVEALPEPNPEPVVEASPPAQVDPQPVVEGSADPDIAAAVARLEATFGGVEAEPTSWVLARVEALKATEHGMTRLRARWPENVPPPGPVQRGEYQWTDGELSLVITAVMHAGYDVKLPDDELFPFGPVDPLTRAPADDETPAPADDVAKVRDLMLSLEPAEATVVKRWVQQGARNGTPWSFGRGPTVRRLNLGRGAIALVSRFEAEEVDTLAHSALELATGIDDPTVAIGVRIGRLDGPQAARFAEVARTADVVFRKDGTPRLATDPRTPITTGVPAT